MADVNILTTPEVVGQPERIFYDNIDMGTGYLKHVLFVDLTVALPIEIPDVLSPDADALEADFVLYADTFDDGTGLATKPLGVQGEAVV